MTFLIKLFVSLLCQCYGCFLFYLLRGHHKAAIVEAGYRSQTLLRKPQSKKLPLWDRILYWNLSKKAKKNHKAVWIYFTFNAVLCLAWTFSPILGMICLFSMDLNDLSLWQLGYPLAVLFIMTLMQFPFDLTYLPSVQKRYRMDNTKKK